MHKKRDSAYTDTNVMRTNTYLTVAIADNTWTSLIECQKGKEAKVVGIWNKKW